MLTRVDQEAMLARVREHMADGGQFMFDKSALPPNRMVNQLEQTEWFTKQTLARRPFTFPGEDMPGF